MANTTFNGPVRAEQGFKQITKNATTGAITDQKFPAAAPALKT